MSRIDASPAPWKRDPQHPAFIMDANDRDVCLMLHAAEQPAEANGNLIIAAHPLVVALQALGIHPFQMEDGRPAHGYCFCPQQHPGVPEDEHTGECRDARKALEEAGVTLVTVSPEEAA